MRIVLAVVLLLSVAACRETDVVAQAHASGYVEGTDVRVAAKVAGRVEGVHVREGELVAAGQPLVTLSSTDASLALTRLEAERAAADAQVRLLQAGSRREDIDQATAQVAVADAELAAARVEMEAAGRDAARYAALAAQRAGSEKARDDALSRHRAAEARVAALADRVRAARAGAARLEAGARREELEAARARRQVVDAQLNAVRQDLADLIITAPSSGTVSSRLVEPGELVAPRAPVVVLLDLAQVWVSAYVDEPRIGTIRIDQPAEVRTDAGQVLTGRVSFVAPRAEFTPRNVQTASERARLVYRVKVSVTNRDGILKPGMPVDVLWK